MPDASDANPAIKMSRESFEQLAGFITGELGIKMEKSKISMIQSRLLRRVRELGVASIDEYCRHFFSANVDELERIEFVNAVTTNKTDFFREAGHFKQLTEKLLPQLEREIEATRGERSIKLWSAACSSGEEAYTLAMVLSEYAAQRGPLTFQILATDVSTRVLAMGREAIYSSVQVEPVPMAMRRKYLRSGKGDHSTLVRVAPALRKCVTFCHLNFMDEDYRVKDMFEIIFCRNVLIYFDRPTQEAVINKLCRNLKPGGYLFISHSETLSGLSVPLVALGSACYQKRSADAKGRA
jgi:chemotaxis protein methyltransferase CheR